MSSYNVNRPPDLESLLSLHPPQAAAPRGPGPEPPPVPARVEPPPLPARVQPAQAAPAVTPKADCAPINETFHERTMRTLTQGNVSANVKARPRPARDRGAVSASRKAVYVAVPFLVWPSVTIVGLTVASTAAGAVAGMAIPSWGPMDGMTYGFLFALGAAPFVGTVLTIVGLLSSLSRAMESRELIAHKLEKRRLAKGH